MGNCLIVLSNKDLFFPQLTDLSGRKVAVQSSTIAEDDLKKANDVLRTQGKPEMRIVALPSNVDAMQQLNASLVDAYYGVPEQAVYFNKQRPGSVKIASPTMSARPAGIASPKNDAELHAAIEAAFKAVRQSGEYDKIFDNGGVGSEKIAN
jgi:polar amino acid transport system substrate-binding protein